MTRKIRRFKMRASLQVLIAVILIGVASFAQGAIVINAAQTGGDVVFTYLGTINQGGWEFSDNAIDSAAIRPDRYVLVGPTPGVFSVRYDSPTDFTGPDNFGPGTTETFATSGTGDIFGLNFFEKLLFLPRGYVANTLISGTSTYSGETFATLGMAVGSYTWTWGSGDTADSATLNVVPIPAAVWLLGGGLIGLIGLRRRFKN